MPEEPPDEEITASESSGTSMPGEPPDKEIDEEQALLNFSQCMRDNGLTEYSDPMVDSDGGIDLRQSFADAGIQPGSEEFQQAIDSCNQHLEGFAFGRGGGNLDQVELQDSLLEFSQCLRDEGIEVDDPDLSNFNPRGGDSGSGPGAGLFGGAFDPQDSDVQAALEVCRETTGGFGAFSGGRNS